MTTAGTLLIIIFPGEHVLRRVVARHGPAFARASYIGRMPPRVGRVLATAQHRIPPVLAQQLDDVVAAPFDERWQARDGDDHEGEGD